MELTLVGLQNSGKTTLVNVIAVSLFFFFLPSRETNSIRYHCLKWNDQVGNYSG